MQCNCMMGLFPEIERAWLTIDSDIYVWVYKDGYVITSLSCYLIACYVYLCAVHLLTPSYSKASSNCSVG